MAAALIAIALIAGLPTAPAYPEPVVSIGRVQNFLLKLGPFTPRIVYPEGKISDIAVRKALRLAIAGLYGEDAERVWRRIFRPADRIGLQIDCSWPPVSMPLVDVLIDELVHAGADPRRIYVYAGDERELFQAGVVVRKDGNGVNVIGTASEGFRHGLSRVVLDYCDVLINVSRLKADARIGLWGCVANHIICVDYPDRIAALKRPEQLCEIASRPSVRLKMRLHILDALQPAYEAAPKKFELPPRWPYGGIIVSPDPVAADLVGKKLLEAYRKEKGIKSHELSPQPEYLEAACTKLRLSRAIPGPVQLRITGYTDKALLSPGAITAP